ncbi:P-loop containing nucleoside triphosphate hydrolase protein, partial [Colletotrichum godetiae]
MGVTGSGKSSFVSMCCGKQVKIGHDLNSCTSVVQVHSFKLSPNQTVYLIDTPGFDDTDISDTEVLRAIAHWLNESYKKKVLLRGILYFHRITDVRMTGSAKKNILMFKKLCGNNALQNVALVTSMWDQVLKEDGGRREKQLIETPQYWGYMVSKGSITLRHDNTVASALAIVRRLADGEGDPVKLDVQDEMIDRQKLLDQTEAWQELEAARIEEHKKWETKQRENEKQLE